MDSVQHEKDHVQSEVYRVINYRKLLRFLAPTLIRIFVLLAISTGFAAWGLSYLSSASASSLAQPELLNPPSIYLRATSPNLKAVVTKAVLSPSALSFDLSIAAPSNSRKKLDELTISIWNAQADPAPQSGWSSSAGNPPEETRTIDVPSGSSFTGSFELPLTHCSCYEYKAPYLLATGLGANVPYFPAQGGAAIPGVAGFPYPTPAASGPGANGPYFTPPVQGGAAIPGVAGFPYPTPAASSSTPAASSDFVFFPVIEQDMLDLSSAGGLGGGVFTLSTSSYPSAQQVGPATWQWQEVNPPESIYFRAESVSGKDVVDSKTFKAGLLLGVAGSGIIVVVDHLFDIWRERREYLSQSPRKRSDP
jgi:hypothetical protein